MSYFSKKPIRRLFFVLVYIIFSLYIVIQNNFNWLIIVCLIPIIFCGYIAIVKSKIIKDEIVNKIFDDYSFDIYSIIVTMCLLYSALSSSF